MRRKNTNSVIYVAIAAIAVIVIVIAISSGSNSGGIFTGIPTPMNQQSSITTPPVGTQPIIQTDLQRLESESNIPPEVYEKEGVTRFINFDLPIDNTIAPTPLDKAKYFLGQYKNLIPVGEYKYEETITDEFGNSYVRFTQTYKGIPVYGSDFKILINKKGNLISFNGGYSPNLVLNITPMISADLAIQRVKEMEKITNPQLTSTSELTIYDPKVFGEPGSYSPRLSWVISLLDENIINTYIIDANTGEIIALIPEIIEARDRNVYDAKNQQLNSFIKLFVISGKVMNESGTIKGKNPDEDAIELHQLLGDIYNYFNEKFSWDSYDNNGASILAAVNVNLNFFSECPNAWFAAKESINLNNKFFFCDGTATNVDIPAHEFTHAITASTAKLIESSNAYESGALNESYSDIFAAMIDNTNGWVISWDKEAKCVLRDISQPQGFRKCLDIVSKIEGGIAGLPDHYKLFEKPGDQHCSNNATDGCAHYNSTIPSKAAQLLTEGGNHYGIAVTGIGKEKVEQIYFKTLTQELTKNSNFLDSRYATIRSCFLLEGQFGITLSDCQQVVKAFEAVGIVPTTNNQTTPAPPPPPLPIGNVDSSTVMVLDTSGSMDEADITGLSKLQAAQRAAGNILNIASSEAQQSNTITTSLGLVNYNNSAAVNLDLTTDYTSLQNEINNLSAGGGTGMAEGLQTGIGLFGGSSSNEKQMIILLSDGMANIPIDSALSYDEEGIKQEVINLASQAGNQGICVYTIGFGIPGTTGSISWDASIDEEFLMEVAAASGCGSYYNAQDSIQLSNVFVELRHTSMGNVLFERTGQIAQGEEIDLGTVAIPANQELALFTLNWPGSKLELNIQDPAGTPVDENYPGATFALSPSIVSVVLSNPMPGDWRLGILGVDVPQGTTAFNSIVSARVGLTTAAPVSPTPQPAVIPSGSGNTGAVIFLLVAASVGLILFIYVQSKDRTKKAVFNSQLVGVSGLFAGQSIVVRDRFTIGRAAGSNLVLHDPGVSRNHVQFRYANGAWFIQDLGSSAGTYVNGKRVTGQRISNGDQVQIGNQVFTFRVGGQ